MPAANTIKGLAGMLAYDGPPVTVKVMDDLVFEAAAAADRQRAR